MITSVSVLRRVPIVAPSLTSWLAGLLPAKHGMLYLPPGIILLSALLLTSETSFSAQKGKVDRQTLNRDAQAILA